MKKRNGMGDLLGVVIGLAISIVVMLAFIWAASSLILAKKLDIQISGFVIGICHLLVLFIGCMVGGLLSNKKIIGCVSVLAGDYIIFFAMGILLFDGRFSNIVVQMLFGVVGAAAALALVTKLKQSEKRKFVKMKYR